MLRRVHVARGTRSKGPRVGVGPAVTLDKRFLQPVQLTVADARRNKTNFRTKSSN